ncbi:MAG: glycosyltransferase family 39 protein [Lachnospiraceae bacterium]|nr:glycosyltransferase family 39 protein [Lachnospiraceae bacterium]
MKSWDEALYGVNGLEMIRTGEWIVNTYGYEPDYFNLKPNLWTQFVALSFTIFGQNLIGMRFFSPVFMLFAAALCTFFSYKKYGSRGALFTLLSFTANRHLLLYHCARSADADSMYILFCTGAFLALADTERNKKSIYISALCFSLAFLTKSFHAGVIVAVILVFLFTTGEYKKYDLRDTAVCLFLSTAPIFIWAFLRYTKDRFAFIRKMFSYDLFKSATSALEGHDEGILFYVKAELLRSPLALACLLVIGFVAVLSPKSFYRNKSRYALLISSVLPFIMFSLVRTRIIWYVYLCYPPLIVLAADCFQKLTEISDKVIPKLLTVMAVMLCLGTALLNVKSVYSIYPQDKVLTALQDIIENSGKIYDRCIYQHYVDPETRLMHEKWRPNAFFIIELYSALRPKNGNGHEWEKDQEAFLFTTRDQLDAFKNYKIIGSSGDYLMLEHQ